MAVLTAWPAHAHKGATGVIKERMDAMSAMGDASKAIAKMVNGKSVFDANAVARHAQAINEHSRDVVVFFPPGSLKPPSEARPTIWQRWDEFEALALELESSSALLTEVAASDNASVRSAFTRVSKTCKSCHKHFRKRKAK